jgi:hypothetical protein
MNSHTICKSTMNNNRANLIKVESLRVFVFKKRVQVLKIMAVNVAALFY